MSQLFGPNFSLPPYLRTVKRKIFMSYHHGGDQKYYDAFIKTFADTYDIIYDNSLERLIDSEDVNYVLQRIREKFIEGSSCTIVLCGAETPWRKYVDWEIKATLDMQHGLIAVNLPTNQQNANGKFTVPNCLHDNIQSGFAVWTSWSTFVSSVENVKSNVEQAIGKSAKLIVNNRPMMARNGIPPERTNPVVPFFMRWGAT